MSAKLNVSLQSSEEIKILEQNGGDLVQLKSSPMMRPKTYRAHDEYSPKNARKSKQDDSEEEELTHEIIMSKLLTKLQNESQQPTQLKVQENIQRNVNFYEEPDINQMNLRFHAAGQQQQITIHHPQPVYHNHLNAQ